RGLPAFEAVADKLGVKPLADLLRKTVSMTEVARRPSPLRPSRPLNYAIEPVSRAMKPLVLRNITLEDAGLQPRRPVGAAKAIGLRNIEALNEGHVTHHSDHTNIVADHRPWAYSAHLSIPIGLNM